jgi:hypothetical protein
MFVIKWVWPGCQSVSAKSKSEQCSKISLLRNNSSYAHCCLQCCGSTLLPPPLELVVQSEARSAAHRLCSLWCWSYLQPNRAHNGILMRLQQSDPIFKWGLTLWGQHTNLDTNIRLPCWRGRIGLKQLVLLLQSKGSSSLQMGRRWRRGDSGCSEWAIGRTKAQFFPRWIWKILLGGDICYLCLCIWD